MSEPSPWITWGMLSLIVGGTAVLFAGLGTHVLALDILGVVMAIAGFVAQLILMVR